MANGSCEKYTAATIMFSITNEVNTVCCAGQWVWNEPCIATAPAGSAFEEGLGPPPGPSNTRAAGKGHGTPVLCGKSGSFLPNQCKGE